MAITPWKPFSDLDRILRDEFQMREPAMDLYEKDNKIIAEINLPELDPQKTEISIKNNTLRVRGSTEKKEEIREEDYMKREIRRGFFERMISLPASVKKDNIEATYEKGILKIEMEKEKEEDEQKKKIEIKIK
ncbi:MAG TPA: Hsp20/alpha crystallin family protein [Candidatus Pacearchaeota archaeon]|nr:Hsp20/alpha crystallin family protein [Candidatus Pacearchaeota archaeon]